MATRVIDEFGSRANPPDAAYPDGSLKNETVPGSSNDGSPLDQRVGNDWEGFKQSALAEAVVSANGQPDSVTNPQILDSLKFVMQNNARFYTDIVYKASGGKSAVENMGDGNPVAAKLNEIVKCENGSLFKKVSDSNGSHLDFQSVNPANIKDFGAVGDYTGNPLYDGLDNTRVTFSDSTSALKAAFEAAPVGGVLSIRIPAEHYGFSEEVTPSFHADTKKVIILGTSKEGSVLDFVKEQSTGSALYGLNFDNVDVFYSDVTTKCTTKAGPLDGDKTSPYQGLVNFAKYTNAEEVSFERVKTERANQDGHAISGTDSLHTLVRLIDCEGCFNTVTGWNLKTRCKLVLNGGEFYRNGYPGVYGTGYGVAGGSYNDDWEIYGGRFYENYRTGFDNHGGNNLTMIGSYFKNNYARDIAWVNRYYDNTAPSRYLIKDVNIDWNDDDGFIQHAYDELAYADGTPLEVEYKTKSFLAIGSSDTNKNISIVMDNVNIRTYGETPEMWRFFAVTPYCKFPTLQNCDFDFSRCIVDPATTEISRWIHLGNDIVAGSRLSSGIVRKCSFTMPDGELTFDPSCNSIFLVNNNSALKFYDTTFQGDNWVLLGNLDGSYTRLDEPVCDRELIDCTWITQRMINRVGNRSDVQNWMDWLVSAWMFGDSNVNVKYGSDLYKKDISEYVVGVRGGGPGTTFEVDIPTSLGRVFFETKSFLSTVGRILSVYYHNGTTNVVETSGEMTVSNGVDVDLGDGRKVIRFTVTNTGEVGLGVEYVLKMLGAYGIWYKQKH